MSVSKSLWLALLLFVALAPAHAGSIQFTGGINPLGSFVNRVEIAVDPAVPADIGNGDFTIDFWIKADTTNASNVAGARCNTNNGDDWIYGAIVLDRDRANQNRAYGISLANGRVLFGVLGSSGWAGGTICSTTDVRGQGWTHVAIGRGGSTFRVFINGVLENTRTIIGTDFSYPNGVSGYSDGKDRFIVLGAEKHDFGAWNNCCAPFRGSIDELRLSPVQRWTATFTPAASPYAVDAQTAALYHFDETTGNAVSDAAGLSPGLRRVGGSPAGPNWDTDSPFGSAPPPPPPPPVDVWRLREGLQPIFARDANGMTAAQIVVSGNAAHLTGAPVCDTVDTAVNPSTGETYRRVSGAALCGHALAIGGQAVGYGLCELQP